jgi:hypothetical protein
VMGITEQVKLQPQLTGVMLLAKSSPSDCRFGLKGLNLTSEGLMLGVSLQHHVSDTGGKPHELDIRLRTPSVIRKLRLLWFCR